jgi:hypothetical protein
MAIHFGMTEVNRHSSPQHDRDCLGQGPRRSLPLSVTVTDVQTKLGPECPGCGEPWLRPTAVPGRYRCVYCLQRYELVSVCPNCGEHSTIVRMSSTAIVECNHCHGSMLQAV